MVNVRALAALASLSLAPVALAGTGDRLMVVDSGADRVMLFDAFDGTLIDENWLTDATAVGWAFSTPKEAIVVGDEIWVSDQVQDDIIRFDMDRNFLGLISTGPGGAALDNLRGLGTDGSKVYLCNAGTGFGNAGIVYDTTGAAVTSFATGGSTFDIEPYGPDNEMLLVSVGSTVSRFDTSGVSMGAIVTGLSSPQQIYEVETDGSFLVANSLGSVGARGLRHYNADGSLRAFVDVQSIANPQPACRGVWLLGNGNYLLALDGGVFVASPDGEGGFILTAMQSGADAQYIGLLPAAKVACAADLDGDGQVGAADLAAMLGSWGSGGGPADLDGDGIVGAADLASLLGSWGPC